MRNFRIGEWLPEAMTPLFADWLLPPLETGYLAAMRTDVGRSSRSATPRSTAGTTTPCPFRPRDCSIGSCGRAAAGGVVPVQRPQPRRRNPVAADRALLAGLERGWRIELLPDYQRTVEHGAHEVDTAEPLRLIELVDQVGHCAGRSLWSLAVVGGSAWKMEAALTRFVRRHLPGVLDGEPQVLLSGLPGAEPTTAAHAVYSLDWYQPTSAELGARPEGPDADDRHRHVAAARTAAEQACRVALADRVRASA
jgi:hypothetical protein